MRQMNPSALFSRVTESLETFASAQYSGSLPDGSAIVSTDSGTSALLKILRFAAADCGVSVLAVVQLFDGMRDFRALVTGVLCKLHYEGDQWAQVAWGTVDDTASEDWQWEPEMEP